MANTRDAQTINAEILKLIEEARSAAYAEGYRDAVRAIMAAATNAAPDEAPQPAAQPGQQFVVGGSIVSGGGLGMKRRVIRAPWGASTKAMEVALDRAGAQGIDISMMRAVAAELECPIAESSARSILIEKEKRGLIERRNDGRWYRIAGAAETTPAPGPQNTAAQPAENDRAADHPEGDEQWNRPNDEPRPPRATDLWPGMPEGRAMREAS